MNKRHWSYGLVLFVVLVALSVGLTQAQGPAGNPLAPAGSAFTYQGQLKKDGSLISATCDMQFRLYDAASGSGQVGTTQTRTAVQVQEGLFTIPDLSFGAVFEGSARWLEIAVQCSGDAAFSTLAPRQELTPAPYALSVPWGGISAMPAGFADGVDDEGGLYTAGAGLALVGSEFAVALSYQLPQGCNNGEIPEWNAGATAWLCGVDDVGSGGGGGDITAVYAGTGLTGGGDTGSVTLYADATYMQRRVSGTCDSGNAIRVINEDGTVTCEPAGGGGNNHDHWGQSWTGAGTGLTLSGGTIGLSGSGATYGVYGHAVDTSGMTYGVFGQSDSTEGYGVRGETNAASGPTAGVYGLSYSAEGKGVWGYANAASGTTYGVYGQSDSTAGTGVFGIGASGVVGKSSRPGYAAVNGQNDASGGCGVSGFSAATDGYGVFGLANAASGTTYGVYGHSSAGDGYGVKGYNGGGGYGVYGEGMGGVLGSGVWGVTGKSIGRPSGYGVVGESDLNIGVLAQGNEDSISDWTGDIFLAGDLGEILTYGWTLSLFSGNHIDMHLDHDNNDVLASFAIFDGADNALWSVQEPLGGVVAAGSQASAVQTADKGQRLMYAVEGTGVWLEDVGTAALAGGQATVTFDEVYAQAASLGQEYQVFVTAQSDQPVLLYITAKTAKGFTVRGVTLDGKPASCAFDYRVVAPRLGYEDVRTEEFTPEEYAPQGKVQP